VHERTNDDDVLILACDGLWDVMTSEEAVNTVREIYLSGEKEVLKIAEEMVDLALDKGNYFPFCQNDRRLILRQDRRIISPLSLSSYQVQRLDLNPMEVLTDDESREGFNSMLEQAHLYLEREVRLRRNK
jgi:hypothetical protein